MSFLREHLIIQHHRKDR